MAENIFFTPVSDEVQKALTLRKGFYASENRGESAHAWLFKKIAYVEASARHKEAGSKSSLALPKAGGLGRVKGSGTTGGMYRATKSDNNSYQFYPKPHVTSLSISAEGDFGSIRKCELKFTVYTLAQLDSDAKTFFLLGADLGINYGWNDAGGAGGPKGKFQGKIYNFTYSVNSTGGFDCTTYAMEPGISILAGNSDASTGNTEGTEDELGDLKIPNSIYSSYADLFQKAKSGGTESGVPDSSGMALIESARGWWDPKENKNEDDGNRTDINWDQKELRGYVSLESLCKAINKVYAWHYEGKTPAGFEDLLTGATTYTGMFIKCDGDVSRGLIPNSTQFVSANPNEIMFPGFADYGQFGSKGSDANHHTFGDYDAAFKGGDLSKTMISLELLEKAFGESGKNKSKGSKSADNTVGDILQKVFDAIFKNSGGRFSLSLVSKPNKDTTGGKQLLVTDPNHIEKTNEPYSISAVVQGGIARNISLASKLPNEMATTAFMAAQNSWSSGPSVEVVTGANQKKEKAEPISLEAALKNIADSGPTTENIKNLETGLKNAKNSNPKDLVSGTEVIPIPLDFSVTLDGIEGFFFGNVITTNYLPKVYKKKGTELAFTVTKVNHSISGGDWTTTLNTVCRIVS